MTTPDDSTRPDDDQPEDSTAESEQPSDSAAAADPDPLPQSPERTVELVEEEAVRGDFVLRWAIVLLAFLLGFTQTDNSKALVHAKAGEYMQSNGFLPPRADVLSYTAEGQPWIQTSWLFDHISALAHAVAGTIGFTLLSSLFAAVAFGYAVHTAMPRVSTWWTVICSAFALIAAYPRFTPTPDVITLAFLAITLAWMYRWQTAESAGFPWRIPVLFVVWANMDPRMWLGLLLVGLYAVGHAVDRAMGRNGWTMAGRSNHVWGLLAACVVAAVANPFLHQTFLEPVRQYNVEYETMRTYSPLRESVSARPSESTLQYYGLKDPRVWSRRHPTTLAGAIIIVLSIALFVVNVKDLDTGYLLVLLGFALLPLLASHELAATALVASILAGLNGQDWYRQNFRTEYSTDVRQIAFSQGGRALTVLGLFVIAYLGVSGRLFGTEGVRIGVGLDPNLRAAADGMKDELDSLPDDARIFNFTPEQGDLLIWNGRKSFIDSRVVVFGTGTDSVAAQHAKTRTAFRQKRQGMPGDDDPRTWQRTLKEYDISHVAPRLYGRNPDYTTYFDLYSSPQWSLAKLGRSAGYFRPVKLGETPAGIDFQKLGLRDNVAATAEDQATRLDWGRGPTFYDEYFFEPKKVRRGVSQLAQHYRQHLSVLRSPSELMGACYLTIRTANEALSVNANDAAAYRAMGDAYSTLMNIEQQFAQNLGGGTWPQRLRQRLSLAAYRQSLTVDPEQADLLQGLWRIYLQQQQMELAVRSLSRFLDLVDTGEDLTEKQSQALEGAYKQRNQLRDQVNAARENVTKQREEMRQQSALSGGKVDDPAAQAQELVTFATEVANRGLTLLAQEALEEESEILQGYPPAMLLYGRLLMDNGELEDASQQLRSLAALAEEQPRAVEGLSWEFDTACIMMIGGDYAGAREIWSQQFASLDRASKSTPAQQSKLYLPVLAPPRVWPESQTQALNSLLVDVPNDAALVRFYMAISLVEEGRISAARGLMRQLVEDGPGTSISPLARYYYALMTGEDLSFDFDPGYVPIDLNAPLPDKEGTGDSQPDGDEANKPGQP